MTARRPLALLCTLALAAGGAVALAVPASAAPVPVALLGLTSTDALVAVDPASGVTGSPVPVTGLQAGDDLLALDQRRDGEVYLLARGPALGGTDTVYRLTSGAAVVPVADLSTRLEGSSFGADFEPGGAFLRIVSDTGQNLRFAPGTGTTTVDTPLAYVTGDPFEGLSNGLTALAHTATGELYGLDTTVSGGSLVTQVPEDGTLQTVAPLFGPGDVDPDAVAGLDVDPAGGAAYASLREGDATLLYAVALSTTPTATPATTPLVAIDGVDDITVLTGAFSVADPAPVAEGAGTVTVTVTRSRPVDVATSVAWATADGSATAGSDYTAASGTVELAPGQTSGTFEVALLDDDVVEPAEALTVVLSGQSPESLLGRATATVRVLDDEGLPSTYSVPPGPQLVSEAASAVLVTVSRTNPALAGSVLYTTVDGGAKAGEDYVGTAGTLDFAAGQATRQVAVALLDDRLAEPRQSFGVRLTGSPTGLVDPSALNSVVTTVSDDLGTTITLGATQVLRSPAQARVFGNLRSVTGAGLPGRSVAVYLAPADGSAAPRLVRTVLTGAGGAFATLLRPTVHTRWTAVYGGAAREAVAVSPTRTTRVAFSLPTVNGQTTIRAGRVASVGGLVQPGNSRPRVVLQWLRPNGSVVDLTRVLTCGPDGRYVLSRAFPNRGAFRLRVVALASSRNDGSASRLFTLLVT